MTAITTSTIDETIHRYIATHTGGAPITNVTLGARLSREFPGRLQEATSRPTNPVWVGCEHANRSCQRLKRAGRVSYSRKTGWIPAQRPVAA